MRVSLLENRMPWGWASLGGYWPRGEVRDASFSLTDETGRDVRLQSEVTARWPDGSVKWSRHTFLARELGSSGELRNTPSAPVTNNDIEMVVLAFSENRFQRFQPDRTGKRISEALGKGN